MTTREVALEGGAPWGFRMHGGVDHNQPLRISRVNPGSKAALKGIREGDLISSINGQGTKKLTNIEAHGLLRNAGNVLKLGLNEDPGESPKRRQYRTVHQETLQETVKRSSVTTYSLTKTFETADSLSENSNENPVAKTEQSTVNGTSNTIPPSNLLVTRKTSSSSSSSPTLTKEGDLRNTSSDHALASQRSSYTNCTLSPSSPSILSEDGICSCTPGQDNIDKQHVIDNMNDNQSSSRSKRRRQRRKNHRNNSESTQDNTQNNTQNTLTSVETEKYENVVNEIKNIKEDYIVQSPGELSKINSGKKTIVKPVKSRSLDDDDMVKIQEVSELSETEDRESQAIVSEASESEVEWEETATLDIPPPLHGSLSTFTLPLEVCSSEQITLLSPEEEKSLRDFLGSLNLVNGPEEAANKVYEKNSIESIKLRKAKKKAELDQYFFPIYQNPRYLDVISEESSDRDSDREQTNKTRILRKGTPEQDLSPVPPKIPPRPNRERKNYLPPIEQAPAVLVDTKLLEIPTKSEAICSTTITTEEGIRPEVEVVYLTSSETDSTDDVDSASSDSYAVGSERNSSNEDLSEKTLVSVNAEILNSSEELHTIKNNNALDFSVENMNKGNETLKSELSSKSCFTIKSNKSFDNTEDTVTIDCFSQLTPPPTPENVSPKETKSNIEIYHGVNQNKADTKPVPFATVINVSSKGDHDTHDTHNKKEDILVRKIGIDDTTKYLTTLEIDPNGETIYTNSISPPPPSRSRSSSRSGSSSRESSQCTAKYNPSVSSITDVLSLAKSEETNYYQALTLREICLKFLLAFPFGKEILEELADVSKYIESYTRSLPSTVLPKLVPNLAPFVDKAHTNNNILSYNLSVHLPSKKLQHEDIIAMNSTVNETQENLKNSLKSSHKVVTQLDKQEVPGNDVKIDNSKLSTSIERIIPIQIETSSTKETSKVDSTSREFNIPIHIEKGCERTIPIGIEANEKQDAKDQNSNVTKERIIPVQIEQKCQSDKNISKKHEVNIPIKTDVSNCPSKEFLIPITRENVNIKDNEIKNVDNMLKKEVNIPIIKDWVALPTEKDPNVLMCLSPKQKDQLEKSKQIPDEAGKLLELHEKFMNRRSCHEDVRKESQEKVTVTTNVPETSSRLLSIIREEPSTITDDKDYIFFIEKEPKPSCMATLPRDTNKARLNAKDLSEWLNLARNKSMSESNLTTVPDIPENNLRKYFNTPAAPIRRTSLPHDIYEKQMIYIQEKEREIQRQLEALEEEKRKMNADMAPSKQFHAEDYNFSRKGDFAESKKRPVSMPLIPTEYFRQQMYEEYMDKFAEREERKQHKIIKVTSSKDVHEDDQKTITAKEIIHPVQIEDEFMNKVKQKQQEGVLENRKSEETEKASSTKEDDEPPVLVMDGEKLKEARELPKHLQEFVGPDGIWSPGQRIDFSPTKEHNKKDYESQDESIPPMWTPKSANSSPVAERKEFKPVNFQSPVLSRRNRTSSENLGSKTQVQAPPWKNQDYSSDTGSGPTVDRRLPTSRSTPATGFSEFSSTSRLPKAQNPTITLLQKAREGQLPKGASYIDQEPRQYRLKNERPPIAGPGEILYQIKHEYTSESENERSRKMTDLGPRKFEGIGPVTKDGLPLVLRSEIKDENQSKWYKRMYDTIHKQKPHNDEYVTIRYKQKRAQYPYTSGYLSEPEPGAYDSDFTDYKYQTLDRRRPAPQDRSTEYISSTMPRPTVNRSISSDVVRNSADKYANQPGRIENYTPGKSSISEKEAKQWWDEVMDIFDGWLDDNSALPSYEVMFARALSKSHLEQQRRVQVQPHPRSFINQALKESGYESDSTLVFRRKEEAIAQQLSPKEQREAYKFIQKGGDIPLHGLRKPAPERPKETEFVEFFPISPTLTRIRVHKNIKPQKEVLCYPVTVQHQDPNTFSAYKRIAPSSAIPTPPPIPPPSPPRRKSSRNNPTLRLVSTMKVKTEKSPLCKRHETCFTTTSNIDKSKVNYLKDKITCKLSPTPSKRSPSPKIRVTKKVTASTDLKNKITSTLTTSKDVKTSARKIQSKTNVHNYIGRSKSTDSVRNTIKTTVGRSPVTSSMESLNLMRSSPKTFRSEKRKFDLNIKTKLVKSPDLLSPTEVKKASMMTLPQGTVYKKSNAVLASSKNSGKIKEFLPVKVGISDKGRNILKPNVPSSPKPKRVSPCPSSSSSTKVRSLESLSSPKLQKKKSVIKTKSVSSKDHSQKSKKEQINDEIKKDIKSSRPTSKSLEKIEGLRTYKRSDANTKEDFDTSSILTDIRRQKNAIESNHFFQHLFLRDISPTPSNTSRNSWIVEKTNQLTRRRSSVPEPTVSAMKVYLKHTRPVSDSKFISLDIARIRSRSASPKSVTFDDSTKFESKPPKRSSSLPAKLIFSQTSRPISPVVQHKKFISPPPSPKLCRSPSCRKIMQYKSHQVEKKQPELSLYMCPSLNHSTTSLDSLRSEDYYKYFTDQVHGNKYYDKFKDLNQFYTEIEKVGQLEKVFSVKPRKKSETEIIDYDRWKEVRTRERAEQELGALYNQIKKEEKEKGFLYLPKDVQRYKWRKEYDMGLRVKEKSVDDIKGEFEKIKYEDSDRENAKRRELAFLKDTYKPLWRGFSVANIASNIAERRAHSEGRVKTARQRLIDSEKILNHGIGSKLWSSLSMEQVNILKEQLAEIYNNYPKNKEDYTIHVPKEKSKGYVPTLTVRRNSDSSDHMYKPSKTVKSSNMSENDKKMLSYTLSKELLEKIGNQRKDLGLRLVVGKEVLGAVASAEANVKADFRKEEPKKPLVKTNALTNGKVTSLSETESGSTDESTRTVICTGKKEDMKEVKKKVEYFEQVKEHEPYVPTIHKPAETGVEVSEGSVHSSKNLEKSHEKSLVQSKSVQSFKEYFGETDLMKFATIPLSATRKQKFIPKRPELRAIDISPIRSEISVDTSNDSLFRSRSISPYFSEKPPLKTGEVSRLRNKFEFLEDIYGDTTLKRSRSESDLNTVYPHFSLGHVDNLRRKYEYPAYSGRGRSRTRRGGVVSPVFLRAEDRFMPHINIISKIASLYTRKNIKNGNKGHRKSIEELAEIFGCPVGEVEKLREKFDSQEDISLVGHMYTSSPSIRELRDIAPYLTADWTAHRYPRLEDNTRSLSSPENSVASKDTSLLRKNKQRPKSTSPTPKPIKSSSILKPIQQKQRSTDFFKNQKYDPKIHEPIARYQPKDVSRYKNGWSVCSKPTVSFKDPEPPVPPPKGISARNLDSESPRKYLENEVTIHYKTPVRQEIKEYLSEDELAHRQAEAMKKIYQEERRKKYLQVSKSLQELQDMNSRRHTDNFIPSQKSPISLNRYDDFDDLAPSVKPRPRTPEPRICARALYNFVGQSARELTFRKGDIIYLRRQIDKNWYEGELNAMVGLFPANYVEIIPFEGLKSKSTIRKAHEGQARAKYNFVAQTHLELSLAKGELVVITRKVDENWYEGKIGGRKGIFPANYVEVLIDPQTPPTSNTKPVASPAAHSLLLNGSAGGKESMGTHSYTPNISSSQLGPSYHAKPVHVLNNGSIGSSHTSRNAALNQALHIETQNEPTPYRAMYKYKPQNEDELELLEGDTVYVLEKCDDGWYVGSSERTGAFGTFPGNYVEKI
ncbi:uncharacterized protein LOC114328625 isoform X1 [Diabrotica virgifera virgifera]|uniref:Uncharacterized protein n=2 Tax=Diabrotica virgifera virgifera TaxID=50390 RepID=A0ABM5II46_DIAVI|nr:uncharacterized protein LOC114328625 isoform X1 [Diabrotica virgifera virgifera]XP_028133319.2 uncharacterized protein LOC114328625 isoform X1 [Diabrotica virgifera virgifera]XP_050511761.1 uncharacterized protein LOC114328625 isoform X1 [Diabrotica virgifera virgifera]